LARSITIVLDDDTEKELDRLMREVGVGSVEGLVLRLLREALALRKISELGLENIGEFCREKGDPLEALRAFREILISREEVDSIVRESREEVERLLKE